MSQRLLCFFTQKPTVLFLNGGFSICGADEGSRTLLSSLGSWRSTDELHPHEYDYSISHIKELRNVKIDFYFLHAQYIHPISI